MKKLYIIEVDESEIVECWNEQAAKELGYQEYALKQYPEIKVKPYNSSGDSISRRVMKNLISDKSIPILFEKEKRGNWQYSLGVLLCDAYRIIETAPSVENAPPVESGRTGKWVKLFENPFVNGYECPFCGHRIQVTEQFLPQVTECEGCGADMRGDKE